MTNPTETDLDRVPSTETTNNDIPQSPRPDPWDRDADDHHKPEPASISDPPSRGVSYYNRLIDIDTCSYAYLKDGLGLAFTWQGEMHNSDEFRSALYELYTSTYRSTLTPADLRPKSFFSFADSAFSLRLQETLHRELIENTDVYDNSPRRMKPVVYRIGKLLHQAVELGHKHRTRGRKPQTRDAVLKSILPETAYEKSEPMREID